ncbi:MAG: glycosyltransferase [Candidatus Dojkabacteria bacterium]|nr:MAG: glycosyltransferase [Candidatus Dojkabacteria bacterium]
MKSKPIAKFSKIRVAVVTDWMATPGGSDRLMEQLLKLFPQAAIFTSYYNRKAYQGTFAENYEVKTSFIQKMPFVRSLHRHYNVFTPLAFESFDFTGYDLVISLSAGAAKGVITKVDQPHISIILTPQRSLWDQESNVRGSRFRFFYKLASPFIANYMRSWDIAAFQRADLHLSISKYIADKVRKVYRADSEVLYPGIDECWFGNEMRRPNQYLPKSYFLVVSRLYDYKRIDWAIEACKKARKNLLIVGDGPDRRYLEKKAGNSKFINFLGWVDDLELKYLYKNAKALIFPGVEDFGYTPIEAMALGTPQVALREGGVKETVVEGKTGEFFESQEELCEKLAKFSKLKYNEKEIVRNAKRFSESQFQKNFIKYLNQLKLYAEEK